MARTEHYYTKLEPGNFYHVYNRGVDRKPLFKQKRNYYFFLSRIVKYLIPFLDVYAFCLLGNHFHLLVKIKDSEKILDLKAAQKLPNQIVSAAFQKMFQSYAMAFNKQEDRIGTLFQEPFKRSLIDTQEYLKYMIYYIHFNPQKHGFIEDFQKYTHSSFRKYLNKTRGHWMNEKVFGLFGGYDGFLEYHIRAQDDPENIDVIE